MKYIIGKVLIIEYSSLPEEIQTEISYWCNFERNAYLPFCSELKEINIENYEKFLADEDNEFEEPLIIEKFLIDSKINLTNIDLIVFHT